MSTVNEETPYVSYNLTGPELLAGASLTLTNRQFIQNLICAYAIERLNLELDMKSIERFMQQEADLKGKISALQHLLDCSVDAKQKLATDRPAPDSAFGF